MWFLTDKSSRPVPILNPKDLAHPKVVFDGVAGTITVRMQHDSKETFVIGIDGRCPCKEFEQEGTCIHAQLAAALLREPEKFRERFWRPA